MHVYWSIAAKPSSCLKHWFNEKQNLPPGHRATVCENEEWWPRPGWAAVRRTNWHMGRLMNANATVEQVNKERSQITCHNGLLGVCVCVCREMQQCDIIMPANRRSQCQSNLQPENTSARKAMNIIMPSNRCSFLIFSRAHTHAHPHTHIAVKSCKSSWESARSFPCVFVASDHLKLHLFWGFS